MQKTHFHHHPPLRGQCNGVSTVKLMRPSNPWGMQFWVCPWKTTLITFTEMERCVHCRWHNFLGWNPNPQGRRKCSEHQHPCSLLSDWMQCEQQLPAPVTSPIPPGYNVALNSEPKSALSPWRSFHHGISTQPRKSTDISADSISLLLGIDLP